jgi:hypothetical protein
MLVDRRRSGRSQPKVTRPPRRICTDRYTRFWEVFVTAGSPLTRYNAAPINKSSRNLQSLIGYSFRTNTLQFGASPQRSQRLGSLSNIVWVWLEVDSFQWTTAVSETAAPAWRGKFIVFVNGHPQPEPTDVSYSGGQSLRIARRSVPTLSNCTTGTLNAQGLMGTRPLDQISALAKPVMTPLADEALLILEFRDEKEQAFDV